MPLLLALLIYPDRAGHSSSLHAAALTTLLLLADHKALLLTQTTKIQGNLVAADLGSCNYHFFPYLHLALINKQKKNICLYAANLHQLAAALLHAAAALWARLCRLLLSKPL
jgi:hypothetical protein